jgi:hypothetical protein
LPEKLDKSTVIEAALEDKLNVEQLRRVLDSLSMYDFTEEEVKLLDYCLDCKSKTRASPLPEVITRSPGD